MTSSKTKTVTAESFGAVWHDAVVFQGAGTVVKGGARPRNLKQGG